MKRFKDLEIGDYIYRVHIGKYMIEVSNGPIMIISLDNGFMHLCSKDFERRNYKKFDRLLR